MTTNKPEVVAWWDGESSITRKVGRPAAHNWHQRIDLIRLSDYKALQAENEALQAERDRLYSALRHMANMYLYCVDDYFSGDDRERAIDRAVDRAIERSQKP